MHERNTDHVIIIRVIDVFDLILQPFDLLEVIRLGELSIIFLYAFVERRDL